MTTAATGILDKHLRACPGLAVHLGKLCDRCDARGELRGTITLGNATLPAGELRTLKTLFGDGVKTNAHGEHRLDLTRFLGAVPDAEAWIAELYAAADRSRRNRAGEAEQAARRRRRLLDQFTLACPDLAAIHRLLASQSAAKPQCLTENQAQALLREWLGLAEAVRFLRRSRTLIGASDLGARFFNDSKCLRTGRLRSTLCLWLAALDADEPADRESDNAELLARHGVTDNPTSIKVTVFGNLRYRKRGRWLDWPCELRKLGESVTLSLDNLAGVDAAEFGDGRTVVTCENETPFNTLLRENSALPVVYTAGFPNAAVRALLECLPADTQLAHWGDSDRAGYRIAHILARIRPLRLWRCALADLERQRAALKPLAASEPDAIRQLLANQPDHPFADELRFTAENGWLEQESWQPSAG